MSVQKNKQAQIARRLKWARERAHVSIEDAAEAADVQPIAIRRWEKGAALPSLIEFRALLATYGVIACEILFDENPWALPHGLASELRRASERFTPELRARVELYLATHTTGVEPVFKSAAG